MRLYDNCNDNENHIERYIVQLIDLNVNMETNTQNTTYLGKVMCVCNKQHFSNI